MNINESKSKENSRPTKDIIIDNFIYYENGITKRLLEKYMSSKGSKDLNNHKHVNYRKRVNK